MNYRNGLPIKQGQHTEARTIAEANNLLINSINFGCFTPNKEKRIFSTKSVIEIDGYRFTIIETSLLNNIIKSEESREVEVWFEPMQ